MKGFFWQYGFSILGYRTNRTSLCLLESRKEWLWSPTVEMSLGRNSTLQTIWGTNRGKWIGKQFNKPTKGILRTVEKWVFTRDGFEPSGTLENNRDWNNGATFSSMCVPQSHFPDMPWANSPWLKPSMSPSIGQKCNSTIIARERRGSHSNLHEGPLLDPFTTRASEHVANYNVKMCRPTWWAWSNAKVTSLNVANIGVAERSNHESHPKTPTFPRNALQRRTHGCFCQHQ